MELLIYLSLAPVIALIILFYVLDKYEPEPKHIVLKVFGFGVLSVVPVAIVECLYSHYIPDAYRPDNLVFLFISLFISVGMVEELAKFLVVILRVYRSPEFDEPYDGIIYTVSASLGFAALENICYVIMGGVGVGILRAVLSVPGHALFGGLMGYFIGISRFKSPFLRIMLLLTGFFTATLAHTIFDFLILSKNDCLILCLFPFMLVMVVMVFLFVRSAQLHSYYRYNPQKEGVPSGSDKKCTSCGFSMPDDSVFCSHCGTHVPEAEKPPGDRATCPGCGYAENLVESSYCIQCGKPLRSAQDA